MKTRAGLVPMLGFLVACLDPPPGLPPEQPKVTSEKKTTGSDADNDPMGGNFTMEQATADLAPGTGPIMATIETSFGSIRCELFDKKAPVTVANFIGLARGLRPFKDNGKWVTRNAYDGTTFHRVIEGFMIQGGDPRGTGKGEPGYILADELWPGSTHDHAGQLCMANRGRNTNGMQFFITDAPQTRLDGTYTIFGECTPTQVVHAIATVRKGPGDRPESPVVIQKVTIDR